MRGPALEVENLVKQYDDVTAVDELSFEVYAGEFFGLLGPNGSGKTTTIRTIMDIFKPDSGAVRVFYDNLKVMGELVYLARLKSVDGKLRYFFSSRSCTVVPRPGFETTSSTAPTSWARCLR